MAQVSQAVSGRSTAAASTAANRTTDLPAAAPLDLVSTDRPRDEMSILRVARRLRAEWRRNRYSRLKPA